VANNSQEWIGISGESYVFGVFPINTNFTPSIDGNYIFAKQLQDGWHAVYIGEGDIKDRTEDHIHEGCVVEKGATHIHAHPNNNKNERKVEESDLLAKHTEAYKPKGCNVKPGG
jgi:hypothetical protein